MQIFDIFILCLFQINFYCLLCLSSILTKMNCCRFLLILITVFSGTFGQRFEQNLINESNVDEKIEMYNYGFDSRDKLASDDNNDDEENGVVVLKEHGEKVDVELLNGNLEFQFCSDGCMDQYVSVCYDAVVVKYNPDAQGQCGTYQCEFRAGVKPKNLEKIFWLMVETVNVVKNVDDSICGQAMMKYQETIAQFSSDVLSRTYINSCDPLKSDKKVVTLYVREASEYCPLRVIGAKRWYPPTPEALNVTVSTPSVSTKSPKSDNNQEVWIAVGIIGGILILAILAGLGYLFYRIRKQKKDAAKNIPTMPPKIINPPSMPVLKQEEPVKTATNEPTKIETKETKTIKDKSMKTKEKKEIVAGAAAAPKPNLNKEETKDQKAVDKVVSAKKKRVEQIHKETPANEKIANNSAVKDTVKKQSNVQKSSPIASVLDKRPITIHPKRPYVPIYKSYSKSRQTDSLSENEK